MTYSIAVCAVKKTSDDGQRNCPKHVEFYCKNKFEKLVHPVGFITRIFHDAARSAERRQKRKHYYYYCYYTHTHTHTHTRTDTHTHRHTHTHTHTHSNQVSCCKSVVKKIQLQRLQLCFFLLTVDSHR